MLDTGSARVPVYTVYSCFVVTKPHTQEGPTQIIVKPRTNPSTKREQLLSEVLGQQVLVSAGINAIYIYEYAIVLICLFVFVSFY